MAGQSWKISGEYMESCNSDYLCPCIYTNPQGPVTFDQCTALLIFRVDEGTYENARLDGLKFALVIQSGKVMADGDWIFAGVIDETANTAHPANTRLALARSAETHLHAFGLDLDMSGQGNNGHFAPFSWGS